MNLDWTVVQKNPQRPQKPQKTFLKQLGRLEYVLNIRQHWKIANTFLG